MKASKNRREQGELQGAAQRVTRHTMIGRRGMSEHATQQITRAAGYWRPDVV